MALFSRPGNSQRHVVGRQRRIQLLLSYGPDWVLTIVLAAIFFSLNKVPGFKREFSITDTSLRHTFATKERVPTFALYMICLVAPAVLQPIINLLTIRSWWDFHNGTLGLVFGLALTGVITQFTKITVGRPRPDVIARCIPLPGTTNPPLGLVTVDVCTQTNVALITDGWRSFPSGHSSLSFAGLGFLSFYLAGKLHLWDQRGHTGKAWLSLTPLAGAALVAISRTMDYRHHWQDVLVGSALGLVMSYFAYRQYYHSLSSDLSHRPYSPRIRREDPVLPTINHPPNPTLLGHRHSHSGDSPLTQDHYRDSLESGDGVNNHELNGTFRRGEPNLSDIFKGGDSSTVHGN